MKVARNSFSTNTPVALGFPMELAFRSVDFCGGGKLENPGKNLAIRTRTNNKLNPHMTQGPGVELGPN